jgi:phenylpyruvate tautomerase PptA (4-oxalocrotonate tautomerase family)
MPILTIEIILRPNESLRRGLAAELADRAGEIFGSAPGETWVKLTTIPAGQYAEKAVCHRKASTRSLSRFSKRGLRLPMPCKQKLPG